jgi:hypothetical protein
VVVYIHRSRPLEVVAVCHLDLEKFVWRLSMPRNCEHLKPIPVLYLDLEVLVLLHMAGGVIVVP